MGEAIASWSTQDEIRYIDGLAKGKWTLEPPEIDVKVLLQNYIRSAKNRRSWGMQPNIKWNECIKHAEELRQKSDVWEKIYNTIPDEGDSRWGDAGE